MKTFIKTTDQAAMRIFRAAFPNTKFRSVTIREFHGPMNLNSYWDSGCRDYFEIVRISDGASLKSIPQNGTPYDAANFSLSELPEGFAVAEHSFSGCKQYGYLHLHPANITAMLPAPQTITAEGAR